MTGPTTTPATAPYEGCAGTQAEVYERHFVPAIGRPMATPLIDAARLRDGERVLDVACGTGVATRLAVEAVGPAGSVTGVDQNPGMLQVARTATPSASAITWQQADAGELPFDDASFDAVICSLALQFFPDQPGALREMRRVLVPDGRVVLGTPGPTPPPFRAIGEALAAHIGPQAAGFVDAVFSLHDPQRMRELLEGAGFTDPQVERRPVPLRLASPVEFFWQYVHSTPLVTVVASLDQAATAALEDEVAARCAVFVDGDGLVMTPGLLVATARR